MDANTTAPLSFAAQLRALVPAVAAYAAEQAETVREKRARGTGRMRDIDLGRQTRERIVAFIKREGCARVREIAAEMGVSAGCISHHLLILMAEKKIRRRGASHDGYEIRRPNNA